MIRKVRVTVHRVTREHAVIEMLIDDEQGTHQDVHEQAAGEVDTGGNAEKDWICDVQYIDHLSSHFEFIPFTFTERQEAYRLAHPDEGLPF